MGRRLVICEKPSVASAVARALGVRSKTDGVWENETWIIAHARGHLLETAEPEDYDLRFETWRLDDLPIIPETFRWRRQDDGAELLAKLHRLIAREDVVGIVNACDATRLGGPAFNRLLKRHPLPPARVVHSIYTI